jgi:hypothetical protein
MSGNSDKAAGVTDEAIGKARQGIGNVVGSDKMKRKHTAETGLSQRPYFGASKSTQSSGIARRSRLRKRPS